MSEDIVVKKVKKGGPKKVGRPSKYTKTLANKVCAAIAMGDSLRTVCDNTSMPSVATVFNWRNKHPEFLEQYARACEERAEYQFEEIQDIADDGRNDWMEIYDKKTGEELVGWRINGEAVQRSKLRVEARKWAMAKMLPKKYGERLAIDGQTEHTGRVDVSLKNKSDEELVRMAAEFAGASKTGLPRRTSSPRNDKGAKGKK